MKRARTQSGFLAVGVTLMLVGGCASASSAPVTSIEPLVGQWSGTVDLGGPLRPFYLTIYANQTMVATWGIVWNTGTITIANGQATYQMGPPPREGTLRLYLGNGAPTLFMDDLWLTFHAVVTKVPAGSMPVESPPPTPPK